MFNKIISIRDGCFKPVKDAAYHLELEEFEFTIYPSGNGWAVLQVEGEPEIKFLTEKVYGRWRFNEPNINLVVDEIIIAVNNYYYELEKIYEEIEEFW